MGKVVIIGNPNSGKTTLFNNLTNSKNRVGNWHGVTTDISEKVCKKTNKTIVDLPGIYSLKGYSGEEKIACEYLQKHKEDIFVNLIDAKNLERGLALTNELIQNGIKPILVVNKTRTMPDTTLDKIEQISGLPTFFIDVRKKKQLENFVEFLSSLQDGGLTNFVKNIDIDSIVKYIDSVSFNITKLDKIFLSDFFAIPAFLVIIGIIFYITFGPLGSALSNIVVRYFDYISQMLINTIIGVFGKGWFVTFMQDGLFAGVGAILGFVPQIFLLMFAFDYLEHSGYLARIAFIFDGLLKRIGLTGKAVFSLIMGFGCTTSAICTTKALENKKLQRRAIYGLGYISCSAKLPILSLMVSLFFPTHTALYVFFFYLLGFLLALFVTYLLSLKDKKHKGLILEVPQLTMPKFSIVLSSTFYETKKFIGRIFTTVVSFSIFLWIIQSYSFSLKYVGANIEESILYHISKPVSLLFKPLGFSLGMVVALIVGIFAKELVISTFAILNGVSSNMLALSLLDPSSNVNFSLEVAIAFILYMVVYAPCVSALSSIRKETDSKQMWKVLGSQFCTAYIIALVGKWVTSSILEKNLLKFGGCIILIAIILLIVIKLFLRKQRKTCEVCDGCTNIQGETRKVSKVFDS